MYDNVCVLVENVRNSKLLALFNTLEERDKDLVINREVDKNPCSDITPVYLRRLCPY